MRVLLGNKNNPYTWVFSASGKTLAISGIVGYSPQQVNLISVYDSTISAKFGLLGMTCAFAYVAGLPVYTYTFGTIPVGASDSDTLEIYLDIPNAYATYGAWQVKATPAINPNLQINTINPMQVGDADQLLGYTSLSSGAVTYSSSDITLATIVVSGGNSYLHAVAGGSPTITASQAANGSYRSATSPGTATIYQFPTIANLITDFDFSTPANVTVVSGKVSQIVDTVGGVVSSQASAGVRPTYTLTGGANNLPYASFGPTEIHLNGALLTSSTNFTFFIIRRLNPGATIADNSLSFTNGTGGANGYGWSDFQPKSSGGIYAGVSGVVPADNYSFNNIWENCVLSHSAGLNKLYNNLGASRPVNTHDPVTPTGGHVIGYGNIGGYYWLWGDIERILLYDRQLSDAEVLSMTNYLAYLYALRLPAYTNFGGDSITVGLGGLPNYPEDVLNNLLSTKYLYMDNTAVSGWTSTDVLNNLNANVLTQYQSKVTNVYTLMIGHNDLNLGVTPAQLLVNVKNIAGQVQAKGFKFVLLTVLYSTGYLAGSVVDTYNNLLRSDHTWADAFFDANALPNLQDPSNTTYFADGVHITAAGAAQIGTPLAPIIGGLI